MKDTFIISVREKHTILCRQIKAFSLVFSKYGIFFCYYVKLSSYLVLEHWNKKFPCKVFGICVDRKCFWDCYIGSSMCVFSKFGIFAFPCNFLEYALIIYVFGIVTLGAEAAFSSCLVSGRLRLDRQLSLEKSFHHFSSSSSVIKPKIKIWRNELLFIISEQYWTSGPYSFGFRRLQFKTYQYKRRCQKKTTAHV